MKKISKEVKSKQNNLIHVKIFLKSECYELQFQRL